MRNTTLFLLAIALITASSHSQEVQGSSINKLIYDKLMGSRPAGSDIAPLKYVDFTSDMGEIYTKDVSKNSLSSIKNESYGWKILWIDYKIEPYKEAMSLKWGTKFEALTYKM